VEGVNTGRKGQRGCPGKGSPVEHSCGIERIEVVGEKKKEGKGIKGGTHVGKEEL
jgi:hypothetical protein